MLSEDSSRRISYTRSMESVAQGALGSLLSVTSLEAGDYQVSECAAPQRRAGWPVGAATRRYVHLFWQFVYLFTFNLTTWHFVYLFTFSLTTWPFVCLHSAASSRSSRIPFDAGQRLRGGSWYSHNRCCGEGRGEHPLVLNKHERSSVIVIKLPPRNINN